MEKGVKMISGDDRREKLIEILSKADEPKSGSALAKELCVSRQVIVQDIALLRAQDVSIVSTYKGYLIGQEKPRVQRLIKVRHTDEQIRKELQSIVDVGGKVIDVQVMHPVYGRLTAPIDVYSRSDVDAFVEKMAAGTAAPLKNMTKGEHYHTITAYSEEILDAVEAMLKKEGFLVE